MNISVYKINYNNIETERGRAVKWWRHVMY